MLSALLVLAVGDVTVLHVDKVLSHFCGNIFHLCFLDIKAKLLS